MRAPSPTSRGPTDTLEAHLREVLHGCPDLIPRGSRTLVALSGGPDSTALLHLLLSLRDEFDFLLSAAHFDHGLRAASHREAKTIETRCQKAGISCRCGSTDRAMSGQLDYREARYEFLAAEATKWGADRVVLGHHRDDHRETTLLNLLRGTGLRGLAGIPVRRDRYVRPLLGVGRDELRAYLADRGLPWLDDPSNEDARYTRARVRHTLLPRLCAEPHFAESLAQLGTDARTAEAGLGRRASRLLETISIESPQPRGGVQIARLGLLDYDRADQRLILRKIGRTLGFRPGRRATQTAAEFAHAGLSGTGVDLAGGLRMSREYDRIRFDRVHEWSPDRDLMIREPEAGAEALELGGQKYEVRWGCDVTNDPWTATFPVRTLPFPLLVRAPRPGDRIRTHAGSRKLKKLLNERRVPRSERSRVPVLVGADHRVLWVVGHSIESSDLSDRNSEEMFTIGVDQL